MTGSTGSDSELITLQQRWSPAWKIWRARRLVDPPAVPEGSFCATRMDDTAGVTPFLMSRSSKALHAALEAQTAAAAGRPYEHSDLEPPLMS